MLKIGIIGLGDISFIHLAAIEQSKDAKLVAMCDSNASLNPNNGIPFYTDYHTMVAQEQLDVIHICLPHHLHVPVAKDIIAAGVHVLLEKPVGLNREEGEELAAFAKQHPHVKVCVCLQNRFNESFQALQEELRTQDVGNMLGVKGLVTWNREQSYYDVKPWRGVKTLAGGGAMINQSIHTLDLLQLLAGDIASIHGMVGNLGTCEMEVEDTAVANIQFANGARGTYFVTTSYAGNSSVEIQVLCEKAKYTIKDQTLYKTNDLGEKVAIVEDAKLAGTKFYYGASHAKLIEHFYTCVAQDRNDFINVDDALPSIGMIDAIQASHAQQKTIHYGGENHE
ncbi:MAG: Gfo/Idh/MocA family protein [Erysipelotrichaceae bacterium]